MKRIFASILLSAMILAMFSACSGTEVTLLNFLPDGDFTMDLNNKVVTIGTELNSDSDDEPDTIFEHAANTTMYDAILNRLDSLEKKYNCQIEFLDCGYGNQMIANMMPLASTGDPEIDIIFGHNSNMLGHFAVDGILYPLDQLKEYINYEDSEKFGSAGLLEAAMVNGVPHAVQPVQWAGFTNSFAFYITWNRALFSEFGLPDLHEYYENGTWTFDSYENLFSAYEAVADEDIDLSYIQRGFFTYASMLANGVKFCANDGTQFYSDFNSDKSYKAIDWSLNLYNRYEDVIFFHDYAYGYEDYCEGKVMMMPANTKTITQSVPYYADFEFGVMPFPCGPDAEYGEWANFVESLRGFAISTFSDVPEAAATIINDLCEPFSEISNESGLKDYYREQVFFTDLDTEIFLEVGKHVRHLYTAHGMAIYDFMTSIKGAQSVAQLIQTHENPIEALVLEQIRPNYEKYIYAHLDAEN